jgi:KUP system potassium uptake protein
VLTYLLVALAAPATVIASQALISGVFSLTHQAIRLGFFPRVEVRHTSGEAEGQIYVPALNTGLAVACLLIVLVFRESSKLAAAFGLAVSGTMAITSVVFYVVTRKTWAWPAWRARLVLALFLSFDVPFFLANVLKFFDGAYLPLVIGAGFFLAMVVWKRGRTLLAMHYAERTEPLAGFLAALADSDLPRTEGGAVFLASSAQGVPPVLAHFVRRVGALHAHVVLLTIATEHVPQVGPRERVRVEALGQGFYRVLGRYGFMETPSVTDVLATAAREHALPIELATVTYFLGRETFLATARGRMGPWSEGLFAFLSRNARSATAYFAVPPEQVVEIGTQIDL